MVPEVTLGPSLRIGGRLDMPEVTPRDPHDLLRSLPETYSGRFGTFSGGLREFYGDRRSKSSRSYPSAIMGKELLEDQTDRVRFDKLRFHSPVPRDCWRARQFVSGSTT